ncbi:tyrosine-type recombinase/integrase [Nordella sp. HKS 07]|uniref:tyrosine-type recombinase/integrase n=1 Tax=Nordella sp. HKS 07 TaxID=2712222 RepID=UPI0013E1B862|nr:site-specific integrase [Nordella sp. HKS 07]QIG46670.1 tyrosine-type recombinase/integrase [Nordella sp. HKS 07]
MPRILTTRTLETIKPGPQRKEIPDQRMPGLYLVVQSSGHLSWAIRYRLGGRSRKHTIGPYPAFDLKTARELAAKALRAVAEGRDPGQEKIAARNERPDTVGVVAQLFVERHCLRVNRPSTVESTQRLLDLHVLPLWRRRLIKDITRRDVLDLLDGLVGAGRPVAANRALAAIRKLFSWAMERDIIASSPCTGVKPPTPEQSRDRMLSDSELRNVWFAADKLGGPFAALVKLLVLTGGRREEVARMSWNEVDLTNRLWTLPKERSKNGKPHDIPLSDPAIAILESLPRIGDTFVLTTDGKAASSNYSANKRRLDALLPADMPPWWLHDLRRTTASGMARLGVSLPVIEKVLNHSSGTFAGVVSVYQRHNFTDEKRHALERWGVHVADLVSGRYGRNIVRLETRT